MTDPTPAKLNLDQLLRMGVTAARSGNRSAARALFLALTREYPHEIRAWLGLAGSAANAQEQRAALERVVAIDPGHPKARQALANLALPEQPDQALPTPAQTDASPTREPPRIPPAEPLGQSDDTQASAQQRFPLMNMIALGIMGILIIALLLIASGLLTGGERPADTAVPAPSPALQTAASPPPATDAHASSTQPAAAAEPMAAAQTATPANDQAAATEEPAAPAGPTPAASLPLGTIVDVDGWSATLLRPDYALILDGSIGDLTPSGRFVLALLAISNNSAERRLIPSDLLTLVDSQGRRYNPVPNASTTYLTVYGRGQHGDLALEDSLAPRSGMRSVPVLFDVPNDSTGLVLTVRDSGTAGWPIEGVAPAVNVGP